MREHVYRVQNMKMEADREAVKHADVVEELLTKHTKELEDAGLLLACVVFFTKLVIQGGSKTVADMFDSPHHLTYTLSELNRL